MNLQATNTKINLKPFFMRHTIITYERGEKIVRPDELTNSVIFVTSGILKIYKPFNRRKETIVNIINSSQDALLFGLSTYIKKYTVSALSEVEAVRVPKKELLNFLQENPEGYNEISRIVSRCLDKLYQQVEILKSGNARFKIASILCYLGKETRKEEEKKSVKLGFRITHQMIADFTGLTRETVTVQINKLRTQKYIEYENNILKINNIDDLAKVIERAA